MIGRTEAAYFKMINDQGGVNGRKINFISVDDGYSPPKTVEQTRKLVEDEGVAFIFNESARRPTSPLALSQPASNSAIVRRHRRGDVLRSRAFPLDHRPQPQLPNRSAIFARHIIATKPDAKIGVLRDADGFGSDYVTG